MPKASKKKKSNSDPRMPKRSPAGKPDFADPDDVAYLSSEQATALYEHYKTSFGTDNSIVYHERRSERVHLDCYVFPPTEDRPFITVATMGMSSLPMTASDLDSHYRRAELVMYLEPDWDFEPPTGYIPIFALNYAARYPHVTNTSFATGLSLEYPDCPITEGSLLTDLYVRNPVFEAWGASMDEFHHCELPNGEACHMYWAIPITERECYVKRTEGPTALNELLTDASYFTLDLDRRCFVENENRAQRRAREQAQRNRARRPRQRLITDLECMACGHYNERS